jgi:hypothetical protein
LHQADQKHPLVKPLIEIFEELAAPSVPHSHWIRRWRHWAERRYRSLIQRRWTSRLIDLFFITKAILAVASISLIIVGFFIQPIPPDIAGASFLQLAASAVSTMIIAYGVARMGASRLSAYELFLKATLIDIFFTQFFAFYREGFAAMPGFIGYILVYVTLRMLISEERRLRSLDPGARAQVADLSGDLHQADHLRKGSRV